MSKKKIATVEHQPCPHCGSGAGCLKQAGAYHTHEDQASGKLVKWFRVRCRECEKPYTLREVWPISPVSVLQGQDKSQA